LDSQPRLQSTEKMTETATAQEATTNSPPAYASAWAYLSDELKRLDLLIRLQMLRQGNNQPAGPLDHFRGLVLSESEVNGLLSITHDPGQNGSSLVNASEYGELATTLESLESEIDQRRACTIAEGVYLPIIHLAQIFQLTPFEQDCVLICLAPELNRKYDRLYAYLQDDVTRKRPSIDLAMNLLLRSPEARLAARSVFEPAAPLLRFRLLRVLDGLDGVTPLISRFLTLDDRMVNFLLGRNQIDARLEPATIWYEPQFNFEPLVDQARQESIRSLVQSHFEQGAKHNVMVSCHGSYGSGRKAFARALAGELGFPLLVADVARMPEASFEDVIWILGREAVLQSALLCFDNLDCLLLEDVNARSRVEALLEAARACSWLIFLSSGRAWNAQKWLKDSVFIDLHFPVPDAGERKNLWKRIFSKSDHPSNEVDFNSLASKFRFTEGQMRDAFNEARNLARLRSEESEITTEDVEAACRSQSSQKLGTLARKIKPINTWKDIVLPDMTIEQLREICQRLIHRSRVLGDWGFGRKLSLGKGINALFAGPSGTGKTMATEIIANELRLDLYKIDLSGVVSKYIGETEKNLDRVFEAAEDANAILFFDEADALFGKRSEVRDSHDRYANIEISYLLQKMEEYEGLAILATNLKANLDESFTRRLAFTVHFPFPDEASRRCIWEKIWPLEMSLDADVDMDCLARQFKLSGGNIKNIALASAFLAAEDRSPVTMAHLMHATGREYQKLGKPFSPQELVPQASQEVFV